MNELALGHAFCDLGEWRVSPDQNSLAYCLDVDGNEAFVVHVKRLDTGAVLSERIGNAYYGLEWDAASQYIFYTTLGEAHRPDSVWRHCVGDDPSADVRVFYEPDIRFEVGVDKTADGAYPAHHAVQQHDKRDLACARRFACCRSAAGGSAPRTA